MNHKIILVISVIIILLFVASCAPKLSEEEQLAQLQDLSDEELEQFIAEGEAAESAAVAGQAVNPALRVKADALPAAYKVAYKRVISKPTPGVAVILPTGTVFQIPNCRPKTEAQLCFPWQTCGAISDGCGGFVSCGNLCGDLKKPFCAANKCVSESDQSDLCKRNGGVPNLCQSATETFCGLTPDGCGGTLNCGGCPSIDSSNDECVNNKCQ